MAVSTVLFSFFSFFFFFFPYSKGEKRGYSGSFPFQNLREESTRKIRLKILPNIKFEVVHLAISGVHKNFYI